MMNRLNKKVFLLFFISSCCLIILLVVSLYLKSDNQNNRLVESNGPLLPILSTEGHNDPEFEIANVANNSGMSGTAGIHHTHSNVESDMWKVTGDENQEVFITFDLGKVVPLGEMWIWNFNANGSEGNKSHYGLKNIQIFYSTDGEDWQEWKGDGYPFRLAVGNGTDQLRATNLDDNKNSPIQFSGLATRFIQIKANAKPGDGNWSSQDQDENVYGLSEVRFFHYNKHVIAGEAITPISVHIDGEVKDQNSVENIINNFGVLDKGKHGNSAETMWLASTNLDQSFSLIFDLGGTYPLRTMNVWNYNAPDQIEKGLKNIQIFYSLDKENWLELKGKGYPYQLAMASGEEGINATNVNDKHHSPIEFGGVSAKFIKIMPNTNEGNWGAKSGETFFYGLSAVEFIADSGIAAEPVYEWDELFSKYNEWTGADGTYSIPLSKSSEKKNEDEDKTLFLFSDTYIGKVHPISRQRLQANMLNNSLAILEGIKPDPEKIEFIWDTNTADVNLFTPKTERSPKGSWYWLQDAVIVEDEMLLFPLLMVHDASGEAGFDFSINDVTMISLPLSKEGPLIEQQEQVDTPLYKELVDGTGSIVFGAGILDDTKNDENYIYIYGYRDMKTGEKDLVVSRTKKEDIRQFDKWEYWDGMNWSDNILDAAVLIEGVSPELSVDYIQSGPYKDKYVLVYEKDTLSGYIAISTADHPEGPFSESEIIYFVPEADQADNKIFTYNAKAHPHLSEEDELLISYNVNTTNPSGNIGNADIYRPRWIRVREIK